MRPFYVLLVTALLPVASGLCAAVYKTIDEQGAVSFSDILPKSEQVKEIILQPVNTLKMTVPKVVEPVKKGSANNGTPQVNYQLVINTPADLATLRGTGSINVNVNVIPTLAKNHTLDLLLDGVKKIGPQRMPHFLLKNIDRGAHQITVRVLDNEGKPLKETTITVYVFRPFIRSKPADTDNGNSKTN
ncbi:MAG: hypothetical protein PUP46_09195 [Endozoicomonas sp. (ex Botrylloides leachii)]|nr:hypothetical protein [Endozoicomonas sp. (ex Botrylloides leachii)]